MRSREGFRVDPARHLFAHDRSRFHVPGKELGAHPRTPPNRLRWRVLASLRQNTNCRLLQRQEDARARPRASDPRAHRREGVSTRTFASPSLPLRAFWARSACDSPCLSSKGGQRATPHLQRHSRTGASPSERVAPKVIALPLYLVRSGTEKPTDGCAADGRDDGDVRMWTDEPRAKVHLSIRKRCLRRKRNGSLLLARRAPRGRRSGRYAEGWRHLP